MRPSCITKVSGAAHEARTPWLRLSPENDLNFQFLFERIDLLPMKHVKHVKHVFP